MEIMVAERDALVARKLELQQRAGKILTKIDNHFAVKKGFATGEKVPLKILREWVEERKKIILELVGIDAKLAKLKQPKRFEGLFLIHARKILSREQFELICAAIKKEISDAG